MAPTRILAVTALAAGGFVSAIAETRADDGESYRRSYRSRPRTSYRVYSRDSYGLGRAATIQAMGDFNLATSEAWINQQEAYRRHLENRGRAARTYFEMREMNQAYREPERGPPPTVSQLERMAKSTAPDRLSPGQLDPETGAIHWPPGLRLAELERDRRQIEEYFRRRSDSGRDPGFGGSQEALNAILNARRILRSQIRQIDPTQYIDARRFLESLAYEARQ